MSKFSTKVKYINTNHPNIRLGLLKGNYEELPENEPVFHMSIHQYYEHRPFGNLFGIDFDNMSLAEFVSDFELRKTNVKDAIPLLDNKGYIVPRSKTAILRYYLHFDETEDLARGLLILFHPFRDELKDIHSRNVVDLMHDDKDAIEELRSKYEKHMNLVGFLQEVEKLQEDRDDNDEENEEQPIEIDDLDELLETTSEKDIENFVKSMKNAAKKVLEKNKETDMPSRESLREKAMLLNPQQRQLFDDIC